MQRRPDGSATSADVEGSIRDRGIAIAACEAKRRLLVDGWPAAPGKKH